MVERVCLSAAVAAFEAEGAVEAEAVFEAERVVAAFEAQGMPAALEVEVIGAVFEADRQVELTDSEECSHGFGSEEVGYWADSSRAGQAA